MPKNSKLKGKKKNPTDKDDKNKEEINAEKKKKLLTEIRHLKLLVTQTECNLTPIRFSDVRLEENSPAQSTSAVTRSSTELTDIDARFQYELCSYAGLCCKKIEGDIVVAFQSLQENWSANKNWIQLVREEECWKLGQWAMPMGIDVSVIIAKYSMDSTAEMKLFLQECKHLVDCHNHREQEFKKLEEFLNHMKRYGFSVVANYGYTNVTMTLVKKNASPSNNDRNVLVYLLYNKDRARPSKISIDCEGENALSHDQTKELHRFFQCFKNSDLIDAAKRTLASAESPFIWKDASLDDSFIEVNGEAENDMESSFSKLLKKKSSKSNKRGKDKSEMIDENSNAHRENDLSSDSREASDSEINDNEVSQIDSNSNKRKKRSTVKKSEPINKKSRAKKVKDVAKSKNRENESAVKVSDKPKNPRASIKKYLTLKDCNENVISEKPTKNMPSENTEKPAKKDDKTESAEPKFIESKINQTSSAQPAGSNEKAVKKRKSAAGVENIEIQPKKTKSNSAISSSTPKRRGPSDGLLCSTPLPECVVVLSTIAEENISAIVKETTINPQARDNAKENDKTSNLQQSDHCVSEESDENDETEVYNNQTALLKDLQAVKYNNNAGTDKVAKKSVKRKIKPPSRGRNKIPKH